MQARKKGLIGVLAAASLTVPTNDTFAQEGVVVVPEEDTFAQEGETVVPETGILEEDTLTPEMDTFVRTGEVSAQQVEAFTLPIGAQTRRRAARRTAPGQQGRLSSFTFGQGGRYVDEEGFDTPQQEGFTLVTTLQYTFRSQTPSDTFEFNTGALVPLLDDSDNLSSDFFLEDPFVDFNYVRETRTTALDLFSSYRRTGIGRSNFFDVTLNQDIASGDGQREVLVGGIRLDFGRETPVEGSVGYRYFESNFTDTTDDDLEDSTTQTVDGRLDFRINPIANVFVFGEWEERDRDRDINPTRTTTSIGVGTDYALSPVTDMTLALTYDRDEDDIDESEGLGARLELVRDLQNGTVDLNASGRETINGFQQRIEVGRFFELPRGDFRVTVGAVKEDDSDTEPLVNLRWNYDVSETSRFDVNLSQRPRFDDENNSVIQTRVGVGYEYDVNSLSSLAADFLLVDENQFGDDGTDSTSAIARLSYTRDVGGDWDLVSGISYETDQEDFRDDRNTGTVFIGLEKTFDTTR